MEDANYHTSPLLGGLEVLNASFEKQHFSKHTHEGYTIGLIRKGAQEFWRSGANHTAPSNSVILVNADQVHDGHSASDHGWSYQAIYPTPAQIELVTKDLGVSRAPHFPLAVSNDKWLSCQLMQVFDSLQHQSLLAQETAVYDLLLTLSCRFSRRKTYIKNSANHHSGIQRAVELINDMPTEVLSLEYLSQIAGLSPYHFVRQFKQRTGLPPHAYQVQKRLQLAQKLIRNNTTISQSALQAGFFDQSHFHRHFKKALGITPKAYQTATAQAAS